MNNGTGQPMHLPTAAFPWAACELDAQQVLCYCHSYVGARQTQRSVSQLLINPDELRKTAVPAQCVTPALQSNWALFPSYRNFMCFLKLDLAFSHQKVKKKLHFCCSAFNGFFSGLWGWHSTWKRKTTLCKFCPNTA